MALPHTNRNRSIACIIRSGILLCFLCFGFPNRLQGQEYYRINADFTVKIKRGDGSMNLTKGVVYYDKNIGELIYRLSFPQPEVWIIADTSIFKTRADTLYERTSIPSINEFTVFHLSLNSGISDFGLKKSMYKVSRVEKKNDQVLSYWKIPDKLDSPIDHIIVAKQDNRLASVVMVGKDSRILSKQFYRDYMKIDAFEFPRQIVQILTDDSNRESYNVTEFKNIQVNDMEHDNMFRHKMNSVY